MKFYVIEEKYAGANQDQHLDDNTIKITTEPARTNSSKEICLDGWCGTTDDWAVYARGVYDSKEAAGKFIKTLYKDTREADFDDNDQSIVAVYKPGKYEPISKEATGEFIFDSLQESVTTSTTDGEISALVDEWEREANGQGCTLSGAYDMAVEYRDELE